MWVDGELFAEQTRIVISVLSLSFYRDWSLAVDHSFFLFSYCSRCFTLGMKGLPLLPRCPLVSSFDTRFSFVPSRFLVSFHHTLLSEPTMSQPPCPWPLSNCSYTVLYTPSYSFLFRPFCLFLSLLSFSSTLGLSRWLTYTSISVPLQTLLRRKTSKIQTIYEHG